MDTSAVDAVTIAGSMAGHDMSMWGLFVKADWIVKSVMLVLILASFWSWAIIFEKGLRYRRLRGQANTFEDEFWSGGSLEELYDRIGGRPGHPMELLFASAMREWRRSTARGLATDDSLRAGIKERISQVMQITLTREVERLLTRRTCMSFSKMMAQLQNEASASSTMTAWTTMSARRNMPTIEKSTVTSGAVMTVDTGCTGVAGTACCINTLRPPDDARSQALPAKPSSLPARVVTW